MVQGLGQSAQLFDLTVVDETKIVPFNYRVNIHGPWHSSSYLQRILPK